MKRVGFITEKARISLIDEDQLVQKELAELGISLFPIAWDDFEPSAYMKLDMAVVRTPWNYYQKPQEFLEWLARVEKLSVPLHNSPQLIRWNFDKVYLRELQSRGAPLLPTIFFHLNEFNIQTDWPDSPSALYVLKPTVSASAHRTFKGDKTLISDILLEETIYGANDTLMLQPFAQSIVEDGELTFLFFNGKFSHALRKLPKPNDFRVQMEHGGSWDYHHPTIAQLSSANKVMEAFGQKPLYARVDMVEFEGELKLMELEIFEPMLYIKTPELARTFAQAIKSRLP